MKKGGLSEVISMVLILLIVLISISIIWFFVQPAIVKTLGGGENGGELGNFLGCVDSNLKIIECKINNGTYFVKVQRGEGKPEISEIKFKFSDFSGEDFIFSNLTIPGEFGFSLYAYNLSGFIRSGIKNVDIVQISKENVCRFSGTPVSCSEGPLELGKRNETNQIGRCEITKGIVYLDDFEDDCTRMRNGLINSDIEPIPNIGFHSVGASNLPATSTLGAKFHRIIISWHKVYDENGQLKQDLFDNIEPMYRSKNTKILLTIRPNDPNRSTCSYDIGERNIDETDSYPKNETEWQDYVKFVVDKYYVQPVNNGVEPVFAGIQLGNEWSYQFTVNTTNNPNCNPNLVDPLVKLENMIKLMNLTYSAIQDAQQNLPNGVKRLPMTTFGITEVDNFALKRGFNLEDKTYGGFFEKGIREIYPEDLSEGTVFGVEKFIIQASPYYDYLDIHLRGDYYQDYGYVAQWIRDVWDKNGITGKGLSATEFGGPLHFYTTKYQEYYISSSLAHSFFEGFDSIAWASWIPTKKLLLSFSLEAMIDWNNQPRQYARNGYKLFTDEASGYSKIRLIGKDTYVFLDLNNDELGRINISENIPSIPITFNQCSDGLDNDNDGLIDSQDDFCGQGNFVVDVEFNEAGIYF